MRRRRSRDGFAVAERCDRLRMVRSDLTGLPGQSSRSIENRGMTRLWAANCPASLTGKMIPLFRARNPYLKASVARF